MPLFPVTIEDVADLFPLTRPHILLVAAGDDTVYAWEEGGAEELDELVRADLQTRAGRLVLLPPANMETVIQSRMDLTSCIWYLMVKVLELPPVSQDGAGLPQ